MYLKMLHIEQKVSITSNNKKHKLMKPFIVKERPIVYSLLTDSLRFFAQLGIGIFILKEL